MLLPIAAAGGSAYWCCTLGSDALQAIGGLLLTALAAYVLMQLVAVYALIRIRSRIVSGIFIFLMAGSVFLHTELSALAATACLTLCLMALFHTYENRNASVDTLHTYALLATGSLFYAPLLWLAPILLFSQAIFLRSLSSRTLKAALIGLLTPFWIWFCILLCQGDTTPLIAHIQTVIPQEITLNIEVWRQQILHIQCNASSAPLIMTLFVLLLFLSGFFHYTSNKFDDKIQVRTYYYTFLLLQCVFVAALLLMPTRQNYLLPLIILSCAPTIGHLFALTHSILTNLWFVLCTMTYLFILILNL